MEPETVLDSVEFHFTPTRTRCDFVIFANGRTEKLASGLANPFLVQLKAARDQIANGGGYSISLMPDSTKDKTWFTKGTVERFVRFVSNPAVLERVSTIEAEISHIGEAITIHSNFHLGIKTLVNLQTSCTDSIKGHTVVDEYTEREAVLNQEKNSNFGLLRVLESRRSSLQKKQEMAFGRAITAGFNPDHIRHLVLFAACFGASRLLEACLRYMKLWKKKHETGLRSVEIEANRVVKSPSKFLSLDIPTILNSSEEKKQTEEEGSAHPQQFSNLSHGSGFPVYGGHPNGVLFQGQYQAPYAQWWMHPSPVGHFYQHYPGEMMHLNSCYSRHNPFFQTPHAPIEEQTHESSQSCGSRKHTVCTKNSCSTPIKDRKELRVPKDDNAEKCLLSTEKKALKQRKKLPLNSNMHNASQYDDIWFQSKTETEEEMNEVYQLRNDYEHCTCDSENGDGFYPEPKSDKDAWQVFHNFSLRNAKGSSYPVSTDILSREKEIYYKRKETSISAPILDGNYERTSTPEQSIGMVKFDNGIINTIPECSYRPSVDDLVISEQGSHAIDYPARGNNDVLPSELTTIHKNLNALSGKLMTRQLNKELDSMSLMPNYGIGRSNLSGSESVTDCELVVHEKKAASKGIKVVDGTVASNVLKRVDKQEKNVVCMVKVKTSTRKGKSLNLSTSTNGQMLKVESSTRKGKSSNLSTSTNGQTSERLRVYKAGPQEIKKLKEEADIKRLETLKRERQQRISARSNSAVDSHVNPPSMLNHTLPVRSSSKSSGRELSSSPSYTKLNTKTSSLMLSKTLKRVQLLAKPNVEGLHSMQGESISDIKQTPGELR